MHDETSAFGWWIFESVSNGIFAKKKHTQTTIKFYECVENLIGTFFLPTQFSIPVFVCVWWKNWFLHLINQWNWCHLIDLEKWINRKWFMGLHIFGWLNYILQKIDRLNETTYTFLSFAIKMSQTPAQRFQVNGF